VILIDGLLMGHVNGLKMHLFLACEFFCLTYLVYILSLVVNVSGICKHES
jgi:hypothetical protein